MSGNSNNVPSGNDSYTHTFSDIRFHNKNLGDIVYDLSKDKKTLSYHSKMNKWNLDGEYSILNTVGRGHEFILDTKYCVRLAVPPIGISVRPDNLAGFFGNFSIISILIYS